MDELQKLSEEEQKLQEKLQALQERRRRLEQQKQAHEAAIKEDRSRQKPVKLIVKQRSGGSLMVASPYRPDVVKEFKATPKHYYKGRAWEVVDGNSRKLGQNLIPIKHWSDLEERLQSLPKVTIEWRAGVKDDLEWYLNAPPWEITAHPDGRHLKAKAGPETAKKGHRVLIDVPGASWDWDDKSWTLPVTEAFRVFETFNDIEGVVYDERARNLVFKQVRAREKLDNIAQSEDQPSVDVGTFPDDFDLRPFQRVGIKFAETCGGRFILADGTGLGKTIQSLAYAERQREENADFQTIIICPAHLKMNWQRELERLTGETPYVCNGRDPGKYDIQKIIADRPSYVIINYDILGSRKEIEEDNGNKRNIFRWSVILKMSNPDLLVIDEAHYIKNPDAYRSKATRKLSGIKNVIPLTATPVLNRAEEMWPLLYMVEPEVFKSYTQYVKNYTINGTRPRNIKKLREMLRPRYLRRTKADVLEDLPPINRIVEFHELSKENEERYKKVLKGVWELMAEYDPQGRHGGETSVMTILAEITRLKQVCAIDKTDHVADLATTIVDGADNGGKVLIYSHFKASALAIKQKLGGQAVCTVRRGTTDFKSLTATKRDELFERVRDDDDVKYVVTTEAAKEGHNLEFCDWVIFNDLFWNPSSHHQCEGRAHGRLSNPHHIDSYYIVCGNTIEEWIMELLEKKLKIFSEVVEGVELSRGEDESIANKLIERMKQEMWQHA